MLVDNSYSVILQESNEDNMECEFYKNGSITVCASVFLAVRQAYYSVETIGFDWRLVHLTKKHWHVTVIGI